MPLNPFSPLFRIKNDSSGILRSRGDNFLLKNVEIFKIRQKFAEIGRFEFENIFCVESDDDDDDDDDENSKL